MTNATSPPDALYIAAKAPRPGLAKTRLARHLGQQAALLLYRAFLRDLSVNAERRFQDYLDDLAAKGLDRDRPGIR